MRITNEQIQQAYIQGKRVYFKDTSLVEAKNFIAQKTGMNEGSASGYVDVFIKMMNGTCYTRMINVYGTDYYLKNIKKDFGLKRFSIAIASVKNHLEYYEGVGKSSQPAIHKVLKKHIKESELLSTFDEINDNFENQIRSSLLDDSETRKTRLKAAEKKPGETEVKIKIYIRNPDVVAEVLSRANGVCEKCNKPAPFKRAKNNTPYLEVHHKIHLSNGGDDTIKNALALCPNCHRELHYGINL